MEIVVEDPRTDEGTKTYEPDLYRYEEGKGMWSLILERDGEDVERKIPTERVVYVETEPQARH
ncbi:hypothetical protein [Halopiger goleimassiliensis]|uniref:hypothetical protein n=1 Tax=Halopiger goleimassiliensis TaxID=1293048 RepID=UPI000677E71C|nr:hypothetical protein [Halopiger goleimassiliensis]